MDTSTARVYSARLGAISDEQLQAALDHFGLGEFVSAEPIRGGNFGQNVYLTSTQGEYVLRGAPLGPHQFHHEVFFTDQLHARTAAPVPWPYRLDLRTDIFGWPYVIMPRMPGVHPFNPDEREELSTEDRLAIARAMGETLAELQRLTWSLAGRFDAETGAVEPFALPHADRVAEAIRQAVGCAVSVSDATTAEDLRWVEDILVQNREALEVPFVPSFVMQDYKEDNAVAVRVPDMQRVGSGEWRVGGVFDYADAYFSDGELDLPRPVAMYYEDDPGLTLARAFVRAYAERRSLRPGFVERFRVYSLLDRVLCWEFGHLHRIWWEPDTTLREWAEPYVALDVFGDL